MYPIVVEGESEAISRRAGTSRTPEFWGWCYAESGQQFLWCRSQDDGAACATGEVGSAGSSVGSPWSHFPLIASAHRGWNRQPDGGLVGKGTVPGIGVKGRGFPGNDVVTVPIAS